MANDAKCKAPSQVAAIAPIATNDGTSITPYHLRFMRQQHERRAYTVIGGGRAWPGGPQYSPKLIVGRASRQLNASQTIVEFFLAHPMR